MEGLNGVKLRVMQNNVFLTSFKTLGANSVAMAFLALFSALETSSVNNHGNLLNTMLSSKFCEAQKCLANSNHVFSPWIVSVSKKWWDGSPKDEQNILRDAARVSCDFERRVSRDKTSRAVANLQAKGMKVNEPSDIESARTCSQLTRAYAQIGAEVGMDTCTETQNGLARICGKEISPPSFTSAGAIVSVYRPAPVRGQLATMA